MNINSWVFQAQWYDPKDCEVDGNFDPYNLTTSDHDNLLDAQIAAVKGAARGDFYHGVAYVRVSTESDEPDGPDYRNEVWKNKWQGWEVIRDPVDENWEENAMNFNEANEITRFGLKADWDRESAAKQKLDSTVGPNDWDNIQPSDFGPEHDFTVEDHGSLWIFYPCSNAAIQWCRKKLPADGPRWGEHGYVVEPRYIADIVAGAQRDNLMSEQDYINAQEEAANLAVQWEDQE